MCQPLPGCADPAGASCESRGASEARAVGVPGRDGESASNGVQGLQKEPASDGQRLQEIPGCEKNWCGAGRVCVKWTVSLC